MRVVVLFQLSRILRLLLDFFQRFSNYIRRMTLLDICSSSFAPKEVLNKLNSSQQIKQQLVKMIITLSQ